MNPIALPTRRQILATTAAALVASQVRAAEPKPKRPWKKALMMGVLSGVKNKSLVEQFQLLHDAGFEGVELDAPGRYKVDEVAEACKRTGMGIEGVVDAFHWQVNLADPDPKIRAAAVEHLKGALRDCKAFGGSSVLLVPAVVSKRVSYDDAYKRSQEEIRKAIPVAEETGVKIAIENVWNQFLLSPLEAARYVDEFESPHVGWHFDIGNVINFGYPEQWVRILGHRIVKLHVKEYSRKKRDAEGPGKGFAVELLEGDNDWPAIMAALDQAGYNAGWFTVEMHADPGNVKDLCQRMDKILQM